MSCCGKTTFARTLSTHTYYCFDRLFHWSLIETLGLPCSMELAFIRDRLERDSENRFVIDGWHLSDPAWDMTPFEAEVYVVYADYSRIIDQYRIPVADRTEHVHMFRKWYGQPLLRSPRFIKNEGIFRETDEVEFLEWRQSEFC
jgi:hypothetical protein